MNLLYFFHCSNKLFWLKETIQHKGLNGAWRLASQVEERTPGELQVLVTERLQKLLRHALETVPFYQNWVKSHPMDLDHLSIDDFPVITKADIRGHEESFISSRYRKDRLAKSRTSGSTGEPFLFYRDKDELTYTYATLWRGLARYGIRPGDKRVLLKGVDESRRLSGLQRLRRWIYDEINRCLLIDAHFLAQTPEHIGAEIRRIKAYRPAYFHGYASSIYEVARYADEQQIDLSELKLKAIVTESEKLHDFQREMIEKVFKCPAVENYGSVEFGMIAQPSKDGELCINEDHVFTETDTDGAGLFTNLDSYAFPMIRFKNGDALTLGDIAKKLPYRTIKKVEGRMTERIKLPNGGSLQGFIVMYPVYKLGAWIQTYQIFQERLDKVVLRIVQRKPITKEMLDGIDTEMRRILGNGIDFSIEIVSAIPLSNRGKRLFVCSNVK